MSPVSLISKIASTPSMTPGAGITASPATPSSFMDFLKEQGKGAIETLHQSEDQSLKGISGQADINALVSALTDSKLILKTIVSVRDKILEAIQEIKQMAI